MDKSILVKWFGAKATLIHGDPMVLDRWLWLKRRLCITRNKETLLDAGCGSGAFTILSAKRGYLACGLSWDERNQHIARERAKLTKTDDIVRFVIQDLRDLDKCQEYQSQFDIVLSFENIEHIINDKKLITDLSHCLKPGGRLFLTTPNLYYRSISATDKGPYYEIENGQHVRKGYSPAMLKELCEMAHLTCENISYCSGFLSQKLTTLHILLTKVHPLLAWGITLPLRIFPPLLDPIITKILRWPYYSICMVAYKPRHETQSTLTD